MADYNVVNPPQGGTFRPPSVDFSWLGELPERYYKGRAVRREDEAATAFPEGVPTDPTTGQPDFREMTNRLMKIGGPALAGPMLQTMFQGEMGRQAGQTVGDILGSPERPPAPGGPRGPNAGPANLGGGRAAAVPPTPDRDSTGDNVTSLVTEYLPGVDNPKLISYIANQLFPGDGEGASRNLNADQTAKVVKMLEAYKSRVASAAGSPGTGVGGGPPVSPPGSGGSVDGGAPPPAPVTGPPPGRLPPPPPMTGGAAVPARPADTGSGTASAPSPGPGPAPSGPYPPGPSRGEADIPPGYTQAKLDQLLRQRAAAVAYSTGMAGVSPKVSEAAAKALPGLDEQIKNIQDYRKEFFGPTKEQKEARDPAVIQRKRDEEYDKAMIPRALTTQANIGAAGRAYDQDMAPLFKIAKGVLNHPDFYSGAGGNLDLFKNRMLAAMGYRPNAAVPQEVLSKVTAMTTLANVNQQKFDIGETGSSTGRIFSQQVDLVSKTVPGLENTPGGNLALVEINDRVGAIRSHVAQMMRDELAAQRRAGNTRPILDVDAFDEKVAKWIQAHPLITRDEARHPEMLAARTFNSRREAEAALPVGRHIPYKGPNWKMGDKYYERP